MKLRRDGSQLAAVIGALALLLGCSDKTKDKVGGGHGEPDGGGPAPTWTNQAYDVQSTWHNTSETKLTTKTAGNLKHLWEASLAANLGTVTVVGDKVYASASNGISMLDADTGTLIWTSPERSRKASARLRRRPTTTASSTSTTAAAAGCMR